MAEPTQFAFRTLKGIGIQNADPVHDRLPGFQAPEGSLRCCVYSGDGRYFAWASPEKVFVVDASIGHEVATLPAENVYELGFSPLGNYIITWQRPVKDAEGNTTPNLKVWPVVDEAAGPQDSRSTIGQFVQKSQTGWNLQYTSDEKLCGRCVSNEVQFYESGDLTTVWQKLRVEGVTDFAVSPGEKHSVAVFVPERKGQPATVQVYTIPEFSAPTSQKTFFKGDKVTFKWNNNGTSLIVLAQTEVDKSNKSYYGTTTMYLLSATGGFDSRIDLDKEGPIHDVAWSPNSKEFGVVYGYMPAKTTIFDAKANANHTFPLGPRNFILFSPHGRFVLVAGFGNLAGQMDVYDLSKNYQKVCTIEASNASVCEWSPDGKHILTATESPRLRVDNGVRIWHVGGGLIYNEDMQELYHVCWRPQSATMHPLEDPFHPAPTPHASALEYLNTRKTPSKPVGAYRPPGARGTSTPLAFKREDEGGAAFVNDGISSNSGGVNGFGRPRARFVPGADTADPSLPPGAAPGGGVSLTAGEGDENLSAAAKKNKKKREAKKAKEAAAKEAHQLSTNGEEGATPQRNNRSRSHSRTHRDRDLEMTTSRNQSQRRDRGQSQRRDRDREPSQRREASRRREGSRARGPGMGDARPKTGNDGPNANGNGAHPPLPHRSGPPLNTSAGGASESKHHRTGSAAPPDVTITSPGGGSPEEKRVRALLKKLRAIEELKMRVAAGEKLENTQVKKILTEEGVRKELAGLGHKDH